MSTGTVTPRARPAEERRAAAVRPQHQGLPAIGFLIPFVVLYLAFIIGPALYGLVMSFFNTSLVQPGLGSFAGFGNYAAAAEGAAYDPEGWYSGSGSNFEIVTGSAIATVMGGQQSPADALAQMRTQLTTLANTASPI